MKKVLFCAAFIAASFTSIAQVGVGTVTPAAALDVVSANSGVLLPRVATIAAVTTPVNGMIIYDLSTKCFKGFENGAWTSCFTNNAGAKEVISTAGLIWMDRNLGATQVATSSTDAASYGDLYQWGRAKDGHESRISNITDNAAESATANHSDFITAGSGTNYNWTNFEGEDDLWQSGLNDPCPTGYRIPTDTELNTERLSWTFNTSVGAMNSPLKLPLAGYRYATDGNLKVVGFEGYYWSSTVSSSSACYLTFKSSSAQNSNLDRADGYSVRCIKE
jgi:uncharacterized protein (TIGR02145 family)